ncbi:MAG: PEP-utilizing enzyme, partial [Gemmatimonadota bacterium]|nr:PEP-utilizing enzyme [Gemmatimonadota bacterium]
RGANEPSADELAARTARRVDTPLSEAPPFLGPEPTPPPPPDGLPPHLARMMGAVMAAMGEVFGEGPPSAGLKVTGRAVSPGLCTGTARIIDHPQEANRIQPGDVLVTGSTSAAFNVVLPLLGAIVTDRGGQLSHAAIVAREYGIPAVVGTQKATAVIPDGAQVSVDGTAGTVELV